MKAYVVLLRDLSQMHRIRSGRSAAAISHWTASWDDWASKQGAIPIDLRCFKDSDDPANYFPDEIHPNLSRVLPAQVSQDYLQHPPQRTREVVGELGSALLDFQAPSLTVRYRGTARQVEEFTRFERNELFMGELRHFLACVAGRTNPRIDWPIQVRHA